MQTMKIRFLKTNGRHPLYTLYVHPKGASTLHCTFQVKEVTDALTAAGGVDLDLRVDRYGNVISDKCDPYALCHFAVSEGGNHAQLCVFA